MTWCAATCSCSSAGDRVPADADLVVAHGLLLDTSLLTGESEPAAVEAGARVYAGTFVVEGEGEALVSATGTHTRLAEIARLTTATPKPVTPLTKALHRAVRAISAIALGVGVAFFAVALALGTPPTDGFVFAIGVTVALVPEALLPTVTLSLAWGAEQMARRKVLVRELEAVETLGSTTFICTDKTGTLTRNEMTVIEAWTPAGAARVSEPGYSPVADVALSDDAARDAVIRLAQAGVSLLGGVRRGARRRVAGARGPDGGRDRRLRPPARARDPRRAHSARGRGPVPVRPAPAPDVPRAVRDRAGQGRAGRGPAAVRGARPRRRARRARGFDRARPAGARRRWTPGGRAAPGRRPRRPSGISGSTASSRWRTPHARTSTRRWRRAAGRVSPSRWSPGTTRRRLRRLRPR